MEVDSRSGRTSIGMILASLVVSGRHRLLLLRSNGEIWPISTGDVQFMMPSSLIKPSLAESCWSPELVDLWAQGDEASGSDVSAAMAPMQEARRMTVLVLRKILRETERMCGKMVGDIGRSELAGIEGLWEKIAPADEYSPGTITSSEAAELILNAQQANGDKVEVKENTLPAYAAHCLLMDRADMFVADDKDMAKSGRFLVRSRAERAAMQQVTRVLDGRSVEDQEVFNRFIEKTRKVVQLAQKVREEETGTPGEYKEIKHDLPEWTREEKAIISTILSTMFTTRSTQVQESGSFATSIMKLLKVYPEQQLGTQMVPQLLTDMGVLPPWDTMKASIAREDASRAYLSSGNKAKKNNDLLQGNELDELRHDFSSHKVFVIDDASASELDDGISVERIEGSEDVWVHVHIADPTRYIGLNSSFATRASYQGSSLYLPEGNVPLFPVEVIMKELSLGANVSRDDGAQGTMTFSSKLSPKGDVLDSTVRMGWIRKPTLVTYDAVNKSLGIAGITTTRPLGTPLSLAPKSKSGTVISSEDLEDLQTIQRFATAHRLRRLETAGLEYQNPSSSLSVVTPFPQSPENLFNTAQVPSRPRLYSGEPLYNYSVSTTPVGFSQLPSTMLVAEMMILAGRTAARFCGERNLPVPYRVSAPPNLVALPGQDALTLDQLLAKRHPQSRMIDPAVLAASNTLFSAGEVSLTPGQHWSMGFTDNTGYIRATSPLRRFDDMLVHWQIKSALAKERGLPSTHAKEIKKEEMGVLVARSDPPQRKARRAGITASQWWEAGLFASRLRNPRPEGYEFGKDTVDLKAPMVATIAGPTIYGTTSTANTTPVYVEALGIKARLPCSTKTDWAPGDQIKVTLKKAEQWPAPIIDVELVA